MSDAYRSFDEVPEGARTQSQELDRLMHWRSVEKMARAEVLALVRDLVERYGVEASRARLDPRIVIDDAGGVRIEDGGRDERQDEQFRAFVGLVHAKLGNQLIDRLPPDTTIDPATGEVRIDPSKPGFW